MRRHIDLVEVSARDGLQSEPVMLSTAQKVELIRRAAAAGLRRIEAVSFVNPKRVPQMADADEVMALLNDEATLPNRADVSLIGLVLNGRGLERAIATGVDEINVVVVATDEFAAANQGSTTEGLIRVWAEIAEPARAAGVRTTVTVSAAFGCPYSGEVLLDRVREVAQRIVDAAVPDELALADSIGVAVPADVRNRFAAVADVAPGIALRGHFHNTRSTGVANSIAAAEAGVSAVDASIGGIGGCPFAPNATGNVATEDVAFALERSGFVTETSFAGIVETSAWLEGELGHAVPGLSGKAPRFP